MAKITQKLFMDGAEAKISRLGLGSLVDEVCQLIQSVDLRVLEVAQKNGAATIRNMIDERFREHNWTQARSGSLDWKKCKVINGTKVCIGVEVQVSGRSELIYRDIAHFRNALLEEIDLGIEIMPDDVLGPYLTDRVLSFSYAKQIVEETRSTDIPLVLLAFQHDGPSTVALPKKTTNLGSGVEKPD